MSPLGVFDSGLGGLSVAREIRARLPREDIVYIADSAYCPYGGRPLEEIRERSIAVTGELVERGAKLVVVACNSASGAAIEALRDAFDVPIVGLEPAVKPAAASSMTGRIAVLATPATLKTDRFNRLVDRHGTDVDVLKVECPGFVELVESGSLAGEEAFEQVRAVLDPLRDSGVDRVVLGCTHYPFLREMIAEILGEGVQILDSGAAVARQVDRVISEAGLLNHEGGGNFHILTTGDPATVGPIATRLWRSDVEVGKLSR